MHLTNWLSSLRSTWLNPRMARRRAVQRAPLGRYSAERLEDRIVLANTAPAIGVVATIVNYTENDSATVLDSSATVTDTDSADFNTGTLTIALTANGEVDDRLEIHNVGTGSGEINTSGSNVRLGTTVIGTFTGGTGTTALVITFNANSTPAAAQSLLRQISYYSVSDVPGTSDRTVTITLTDGDGGTSTPRTKTINIIPVNDAPVIGAFDAAITFTEEGAAVLLDSDATVTDADSANFATGQVQARIITNGDANDVLSINNQGNGAGQIGVSGSNVSYAGTLIGTFSGGTGTTTLTISLNSSATVAAVQALIRNLNYSSTSTNPTTPKTVRVSVSDGDGGTSDDVTKTINITAVNTAPVIGLSGIAATYVENAVNPTVLDTSGTLVDDDSADLSGGTLTVSVSANGDGHDVLSIKNIGTGSGQVGVSGANITYEGVTVGTFTGGEGLNLVVTFNALATPTVARSVMRAVQYASTSDFFAVTSRTLAYVVTDGDGGTSNTANKTVNITQVNDAPTIGSYGGTSTFTEADGPIIVNATATITDDDSPTFDGGNLTARVTANGTSNDRLTINNVGTDTGEIGVSGSNVTYEGTLIGTFTGGTGTTSLIVSLNSDATRAAVQALLRQLSYENVSQNPSGSVTVQVTVNDGAGGLSSAVTQTVNLVAVNTAPTITPSGSVASYTEDSTAALIDSAALVSDPDSSTFEDGILTVSVTANAELGDVLSIRNEGTTSGKIGVSGNTVSFGGTDIGTFIGGTLGVDLVVTLNSSATVAATQALLRNLTYSTASNDPSEANRTISVTLKDSDALDAATSTAATFTVQVHAHNDAPVVAAFSDTDLDVTEGDDPTVIDSNATVSDVDSDDLDTGRITISITANGDSNDRLAVKDVGTDPGEIGVDGTDISYEGTVIGTAAGGTGTSPLVISFNSNSSPAAVQALLRNITYQTLSANPAATKTLQVVINDGDGGQSTAVTKTVNITGVNSAPTVTVLDTATGWIEGAGAVVLDSSATVIDPDSANFDGGQVIVSITANGTDDDVLGIRSLGTGTNQISVTDDDVFFQGTQIGSFVGGTDGDDLVITLNSDATPAAIQILARSLTYNNTSTTPGTTPRTISFTISDGDIEEDGATSSAVTKTINITETNSGIDLLDFTDGLAYTEGDDATLIDEDAVIIDADSPDLNKGRLTVRVATGGQAEDRLVILSVGDDTGEVSVSGKNVYYEGVKVAKFSGGTGFSSLTITFNSDSTPEAAQAILRSITYQSLSTNPTTSKTITAQITDGDGSVSPVRTKVLTITAVNSDPVIGGMGKSAKYKIKKATPVIISSSASVTDGDSPDMDGGELTVAIAANSELTDVLSIKDSGTGSRKIGVSGSNITYEGTVIGTFTGGALEELASMDGLGGEAPEPALSPLVVTFNSHASVLAIQALVRAITFGTTAESPSTADRTISFSLTDGDGGTSNLATQTVTLG